MRDTTSSVPDVRSRASSCAAPPNPPVIRNHSMLQLRPERFPDLCLAALGVSALHLYRDGDLGTVRCTQCQWEWPIGQEHHASDCIVGRLRAMVRTISMEIDTLYAFPAGRRAQLLSQSRDFYPSHERRLANARTRAMIPVGAAGGEQPLHPSLSGAKQRTADLPERLYEIFPDYDPGFAGSIPQADGSGEL